MKRAQIIFTMLLCFICMLHGETVALAMDTGFSTVPLSDETRDTFLSNILLSTLDTEPPKRTIQCFDISENGLIAIGSERFEEKTICIYDRNGIFQYGYSFEYSSSFGIEWSQENIIIYFVRSAIALELNRNGEVQTICEIENTMENSSYWNKTVFSNKRVVGNHEYILKNDMGFLNFFAFSYSQLVYMDPNGNTTILYDANSYQLTRSIIVFIGILGFIVFVVSELISLFIKASKQKGS